MPLVNGSFTSASNAVIKTGGGTLALGSTSSDTGAHLQVNAGTVQINNGSGILISLNGGTCKVAGSFPGNPIYCHEPARDGLGPGGDEPFRRAG